MAPTRPRPARRAALRLALLAAALACCVTPARAAKPLDTVFSNSGPTLMYTSKAFSLLLPLGAGKGGGKAGVFILGTSIYSFPAPNIKVGAGLGRRQPLGEWGGARARAPTPAHRGCRCERGLAARPRRSGTRT
jgi:hypothetical protein